MRKSFNITGTCNPDRHYMVDTSKQLEVIENYIDRGEYFSINRARQFGKTTTLFQIWRNLSGKYLIIDTSFEGVGDSAFENETAFTSLFVSLMKEAVKHAPSDEKAWAVLDESSPKTMNELAKVVTRFCQSATKPVLLLIDEVDRSSNNQLFLNFIGMLRDLYLMRDKQGMDSTFHSVILAGVYDIKNLKLKFRPDAEKKYNSPWNIAADFNVDMTFHPEEIAQMLSDYENDMHTGMDTLAISEEIYKYTTGYPYLVSAICKIIDEQMNRNWTVEGVMAAVKVILVGDNTLIDDLSKNLENNAELREFLYSISVNSIHYPFVLVDPMVKLASMFSYIRNENGAVRIHNVIFEESLYYYFMVAYLRNNSTKLSPYQMNYVINGRLNMEYVITRFADLMHQEYRDNDEAFLERQGRLIFLTFLKPIINGTGFYYVEPQTRDNRRMDLVVTYGKEEFIIELKIWRGDKYEEHGRDQLSNYLATRNMDEGYLVTFDFSKNKQNTDPQWIDRNGKRIFEVVV